MFVVNEDNSIYATRGDIVFFCVSAEDNGVAYKFQAGDVVRIKVYGKKDAENVVLQKDFPVLEITEKVEIYLEEEDTKIGEVISKPTDYWYEVELNPDEAPQTIIGYNEDGPVLFKLFPEGADIETYEPNPEDFPVVDEKLDLSSPRPVANHVIARAFTNLRAGYEATNKAVTDLHVTPQMFGAKGDGVSDDTEAIQAALSHNKVYLPDGTYMVSSPLVMDDTTHLYGGVNSVIKASAEMDSILTNNENVAYVNQQFSIQNIVLDGNNLAQKGLYLKKISMEHYGAVDGLKVRNCLNVGVYLQTCQTSAFYNIRVTDCKHGILIEGCNNAKFYNIAACSNTSSGIGVMAGTGGSGGVSIYGIHAEQNGSHGLILSDLNSMATICGGWVEENGGHGLYIMGSMAYITGLTVTGTGKNDNRWLYVVGDLTTVENCFRAKAAGDESWLDAYISGDSIVGNINNFQGIDEKTIAAREGYINMLVNGHCDGVDGWIGSSTTLTYAVDDVVHSDFYSLRAVASASGASTHQVITGLKVGSIYHFVGYVYSVDVARLRVCFRYCNNPDAATNRFYYDIPDKDWAVGAWVPIDFYFMAKDSVYDIHIQSVGSGGTYYMDDFSLKEYAPAAKSTHRIGNVNSYLYQIPELAD